MVILRINANDIGNRFINNVLNDLKHVLHTHSGNSVEKAQRFKKKKTLLFIGIQPLSIMHSIMTIV